MRGRGGDKETRRQGEGEPVDLCGAAVKVARRLQALAGGRTYLLFLRKEEGRWMLSVLAEAKLEVAVNERG